MCLVLFLKANIEVPTPNKYIMKDVMMGAVALIQGYVARLGFGITLTRNQMLDAMPSRRKVSL